MKYERNDLRIADKNQGSYCTDKNLFVRLQRFNFMYQVKNNNLYTNYFEGLAGSFFGFWFYFFYSLKCFRD